MTRSLRWSCLGLGVLVVACGEAAAPAGGGPGEGPPPAEELARLPGRVLYLAESEGAAAIAEIRFGPMGHVSRDMVRAPTTAEGPSIYPGPVSPDGGWIAVVAVEEGAAGHLERVEIRPLTAAGLGPARWRSEAAAQARSPAWSPDGRFLVFESSIASFRDLYRVDLPASAEEAPALRRLTDHPAGNYEPAVSPDAARIAFVSSRDQNAEIYVMQADGAEPRRITRAPLDDWGPQWAPDGGTLAFLSNRGGVDRIYLCRPDGGDLRPLVADAGAQEHAHAQAPAQGGARPGEVGFEASEAEPAFSPDGAWIAYSVRTGPRRSAIRVAPAAGGPARALTPGSASDRAPIWSPGGGFILFSSDRGGDLELYVIRQGGGGLTRLTDRPGADWLARWSPS